MRRTERNTDQSGQATPLLAFVAVVLIAFMGFTIDSGRLYDARRDVQTAADAAALAAGDNYLIYKDVARATRAAASVYGLNEYLFGTATITGGGTIPSTANITWAGSNESLTITTGGGGGGAVSFAVRAVHPVALAFMQVLGFGQVSQTGAQATTAVTPTTVVPALLTLSQAGCPGVTGSSLTITGNGAVLVRGDMVSNGSTSLNGNGLIALGGNGTSHCGNTFTGNASIKPYCYNANNFQTPPYAPTNGTCNSGDVLGTNQLAAPVLADPALNGGNPALYADVDPAPITHSSWIEYRPGTYTSNSFNGNCVFLDPGIYSWRSGWSNTSNGRLISNELRPPDEPVVGDHLTRASPQLWQAGTGCDAAFTIAPAPATNPLERAGNWGVEVTSVRTDYYPPQSAGGTAYTRESAPSMCHQVVLGSSDSFTVTIAVNAPGATAYNVYANPNGCAASQQSGFGYVGQFTEAAGNGNFSGSQIPNGLGWLTGTQCFPSTLGCAPPSDEQALACFNANPPCTPGAPQRAPARAALPAGDRADESSCRGTSASTNCAVVPGAVEFYFPTTTACFSAAGGSDTYIFSGPQYNNISVLQPRGNTCANQITGHTSTVFLGFIYTPTAAWTIAGGAQTPISGSVICDHASINGSAGLAIDNLLSVGAAQSARLIV